MRGVGFLLLLVLWPGFGLATGIGDSVRARNWAEADGLAATSPDPVAAKLVRYERMLTPRAARADEIDAFLSEAPDWPQQGVLLRRYGEALVSERDDAVVRGLCRKRPPTGPAALLRCAEVARPGDAEARAAWLAGIGDAAGETAFMKRWGGSVDAGVQWERFERLAWSESAAPGGTLARQAVRLDPGQRAAAEARLALRRDDPAGPALFAALPSPAQSDPGLMLDLARWYRRAHREIEAAGVWQERGRAAEWAAPPDRQLAFWTERNALARQLLRMQQGALAYDVVTMPTAAGAARVDATFLAGWIALRVLSQPEVALPHFQALATGADSAITQGRAHYWLGRALAASGQPAEAEYRLAAAWPTTYYGQIASLALGEGAAGLRQRIANAADPAWDETRALELAGSELGRAATMLASWGEARRARPFLQALEDRASDPGGRAIVARLALGLGLPDAAVAAARRAGRDGVMLPGLGWPEAADPPAVVERAVALGLIRQESSFDVQAGSPAGAQGLMQLMPGTASDVARKLGAAAGPLTDPVINLRLGTAYLAGLLERFGGALPPALAGYNAGPGRAREWIMAFGDPATGAVDPIDWVELIPLNETRDYVQRVVENVMIYRVRAGTELPHPVLRWAAGI